MPPVNSQALGLPLFLLYTHLSCIHSLQPDFNIMSIRGMISCWLLPQHGALFIYVFEWTALSLALRFFLNRRSSHSILCLCRLFGASSPVGHCCTQCPAPGPGRWASRMEGVLEALGLRSHHGLQEPVGSRKEKSVPMGWEEPSSFSI